MENDHGTGPATPESPATSAYEKDRQIRASAVGAFGSRFTPLEPTDGDESADAEIEAQFKYRLVGLRRMPRHQRAAALRATREWRQLALKALREKRERERHARHLLWRSQLPPPIRPG
jgi:hypothetical protein